MLIVNEKVYVNEHRYIGSGYVGLETGACLAGFGLNVTCMDLDKEKIQMLNNGIITIYESGLGELIVNDIQHK